MVLAFIWRIVASFVLIPIITVLFSSVIIFAAAFFQQDWVTHLVREWGKLILRFYGLRIEILEFSKKYEQDSPCIVVANHQSMMDIPVSYAVIPGRLRMIGKKSMFYIPFFGWALWASGTIPLNRKSRESGQRALGQMRKRLKSGVQMWIAPEGTRSKDGTLGPFKKGAFKLALDLQVPIVPLLIENAYEVLDRDSWLPKLSKSIRVRILDPEISHIGQKGLTKEALSERVRNRFLESLGQKEPTQNV